MELIWYLVRGKEAAYYRSALFQQERRMQEGDLAAIISQNFRQKRLKRRLAVISVGGVFLLMVAMLLKLVQSESPSTKREKRSLARAAETSDKAPTLQISEEAWSRLSTNPAEDALPAISEEIGAEELPRKVVRAFLTSEDPAVRVALCRDPSTSKARLNAYWGQEEMGRLMSAKKMVRLNADGEMDLSVVVTPIMVVLRNGSAHLFPVVETAEGLRIDADALTGYCDFAEEDFFADKRRSAKAVARVAVKADTYYNFGYSNPEEWLCLQLDNPGWDRGYIGYARRGTQLEEQILQLLNGSGHTEPGIASVRQITKPQARRITLSLARPPSHFEAGENQVEVTEVICRGWVMP